MKSVRADVYGPTQTVPWPCHWQSATVLVQYVQTIVCITYYSQIDRCFLRVCVHVVIPLICLGSNMT